MQRGPAFPGWMFSGSTLVLRRATGAGMPGVRPFLPSLTGSLSSAGPNLETRLRPSETKGNGRDDRAHFTGKEET